MNIGNFIIRLSFGLLFIWGGIEKLFENFLGGIGLHEMAGFLASTGWGFLGDSGNLILAIILALTELIAGFLLIINQKLFPTYITLSLIMLVALLSVHLPSGSWMDIMIHTALFGILLGLGLETRQKKSNN